MFISELHIQGYKRLRDVKLPLGPLTVLIGPNAGGKTTTLEVLELLAASAEGRLNKQLVQLGGLHLVTSWGHQDEGIRVRLATPLGGNATAEYVLGLDTMGYGHRLAEERLQSVPVSESLPLLSLDPYTGKRLYLDREAGQMTEAMFEQNELEPLLSQTPPHLREAEAYRKLLANVRLFRAIDTSAAAPIRRQQSLAPVSGLSPDGANLLAALQQKRALDRDMFETLEAALRAAYPGFEHLDWPAVAEGQAVLLWHEHGRSVWANHLSDGTLRFLFLAAVLLSSSAPPMVMIDEPEVSLHPELIKILSDLLDDASHRTQLLVATQSPELVSWLKPEQVIVLDLDEEGWTRATSATDLDLDDWLKRYTLGELWVRGNLGGRP